MTDRIANPWGGCTPFGQGEDWPVRVDQFLEDGITEDEVDRWVPTASILHSNGDALDIAVKDGRIVGVRGCAEDRVNKGRLGPKDLYGWQSNNSEDRLTRPLVRKDGELVEASWDEAMDRIVGRSREMLAVFGLLGEPSISRPVRRPRTWRPAPSRWRLRVGSCCSRRPRTRRRVRLP